MREYLARFNAKTIKVAHPNQEMFVGAIQNGLKEKHFNKSLAHKPTSSMNEIMAHAECYIKEEESNTERRTRDVNEMGISKSERAKK